MYNLLRLIRKNCYLINQYISSEMILVQEYQQNNHLPGKKEIWFIHLKYNNQRSEYVLWNIFYYFELKDSVSMNREFFNHYDDSTLYQNRKVFDHESGEMIINCDIPVYNPVSLF